MPPSTSGTGKKKVSVTVTISGVEYTTEYDIDSPQAFTYLPKITAIKNTVPPNQGLAKGSAVGEESVIVEGGGFKDGATVKFTSVNTPQKSVSVSASSVAGDGKSLQVSTPTGLISDNYNVTVTNPDNTTTPTSVTFQILPTLLKVTPNQGPADGSITVTIEGAGFASSTTSPTGSTTIYIDSTSYTCGSLTHDANTPNTKLTCKPPANTNLVGGKHALKVLVKVPSSAGGVYGLQDIWYDYLPTITSWSKNTAPITGGTGYSLTGNGFRTGAGNTLLEIQDATVKPLSMTISSSTSITSITIPSGTSTGWKDVTIKVPNQCYYTQDCVTVYKANQQNPPAQTFRYDPTVASISPSTGPASGGTLVTISGSFFGQGTKVLFGGIEGKNVNVSQDGKTITVETPAGHVAGPKSVVINNPDGSTVTSGTNFTFTPIILSMDLTSGPADGSQVVTFTGAGFASSTTNPTGTTTIKIGGATCGSQSQPSGSTTVITCKPPSSSSVGEKDIQASVTVSSVTYSEVAPFKKYTYYPGITNINPNSGHAKGINGPTPNTTVITAYGMTNPGTTVYIGGKQAGQTSYSATSPPTITVQIPESTISGWVDVSVTVSGLTGTKKQFFKYTPFVSSVVNANTNQPYGVITGGDPIIITGQGFEPGITSVTIDGKPATGILVVESTKLLATTPAGSTIGKKDVVVTVTKNNENFSYTFAKTNSNAFAYVPVITGVEPQYIRPGTGIKTNVTITGAGFSTTASYNKVYLVLGGNSVAQTVNSTPAPTFNQIVVTMDGTNQAVGFRDLRIEVRDADGVYQVFVLPRGIGFSNNGTSSALPALNCMGAKVVAPSLPPSGRYFVDPDGAGPLLPFEVYCEMVANGGGWTLVAKAASTNHSVLRSASAGNINTNESDGIPAVSYDCSGPDQKLSDEVIKMMWGGKNPPLQGSLMITVQNGPATAFSTTDISVMSSFSDRCGTKNGPDWMVGPVSFPASAGTEDVWDCGWSAFWVQDDGTGQPGPGPFVVMTRDGWVTYLGDEFGCQNNDCGCGYGWVR